MVVGTETPAPARHPVWPDSVVLVLGAVLVAASGAIHLHLWTGLYRRVPTIGPLFLAQGIAALVLAVLVAALRRPWVAGLAALLMLGTIGAFLLAVTRGLFGFVDAWGAPDAVSAFVSEVAAAVLLVAGGLLAHRTAPDRWRWPGRAGAPAKAGRRAPGG